METLSQQPAVAGGAATGPDRSPAPVRLTARGAVTSLFLACFVTMLLTDWTGWTVLVNVAFIGGCAVTARYTKRAALLAVAVSPPLIFFIASLAAELLTASGSFGLLEGLLVALGRSAPWLFLGTGVSVAITVCRGLPEEIAALRG